MKALIAYYSLTGNTEQVAQGLAKLMEEQHEVVVRRVESSRGFSYFHVLLALIGGTIPIRPLDVDTDSFNLIILGSPIWAGSPVPAINTFIDDLGAKGTICPFITCRANNPGAIDKMRVRLKKHGLNIGSHAIFVFSPKESLDNERLKEFAHAITEG